jgi:hypothetical protein
MSTSLTHALHGACAGKHLIDLSRNGSGGDNLFDADAGSISRAAHHHPTSDLYQFPIVGGSSERTVRFVTPS